MEQIETFYVIFKANMVGRDEAFTHANNFMLH